MDGGLAIFSGLPRPLWMVATLLLAAGVAAAMSPAPAALMWVVTPVMLALALMRPRMALAAALGLAYALPFAVAPVRVGLQPPIVELTLAVALAVAMMRMAMGGRGRPRPARGWIGMVGGVLVFWTLALLVGGRMGQGGEEIQYALKLMLGVAAGFLAVGLGTDWRLARGTAALIAGLGAAQSLVAAMVFRAGTGALPFYEALEAAGYPDAVTALRYLPDEETLRAVGTLVDPNIMGASLAVSLVLALGISIISSGRSRWLWLAVAGLTLPGLSLSLSRGAWLAAGFGILIYMWRRNRGLAVAAMVALTAIVVLAPFESVEHFRSGLLARDESAALRLGEFAEAGRVIASAPVFGVGFPAQPPAAYFVGVSNTFLWVAEHIGLPGAFLSMVAAIGACVVGFRSRVPSPLAPVFATAAAVALVAGLVDHHFASVPHMVMLQWSLLGLAVGAARREPGAIRT
jgi:O-antigen ligase